MATTLLITRSDFNGRVELATNMLDAKINNRILEAEDFDLRELMGDVFYYDFISNITNANYVKLLDGGTYTVCDIDMAFDGLKPVLVYFATSRLIKSLDLHFTPNGVMQKRNDYSDHLDIKEIQWRSSQYYNQGLAYWNMCAKFLDASKLDYPLWKPCCGDDRIVGKKTKMSSLGMNDYQDPYSYLPINKF